MGSFVFTASLRVQGPSGIIALTVQVTLVLLDGFTHQGGGNRKTWEGQKVTDRRGSRTGMLTFEQVWYLHHLFRSSHMGNEETARWAGTFLGEGPLISLARGILKTCRPMGKP